jgi:hypothetical protein
MLLNTPACPYGNTRTGRGAERKQSKDLSEKSEKQSQQAEALLPKVSAKN